MKKLTLFISVLLLLVGCAAPKVQLPTQTTTVYPQTKQPTQTVSSLPSYSVTAPATATATQTAEPSLTPSPSLTPNLAETVIATQQPKLHASYLSPDSKWRVDIIIYDCVKTSRTEEGGWNENAYEELILVNLTSGEKRVVDDQLQYCGGLGAYGFGGLYWSPNNRYFYYTTARQGVPDGCGYWEPPIYRFDVPETATKQYLGIGSRSPDGGKIASWNWPENALSIWNIDDNESLHFTATIPKAEIGPITWSADSQSLVYILVDSWCPLSGESYLVLVDIAKSEQTLLLESKNPTFGSAKWDRLNELSLFDENGKEWNFNLITRELTQIP